MKVSYMWNLHQIWKDKKNSLEGEGGGIRKSATDEGIGDGDPKVLFVKRRKEGKEKKMKW